MKKKIVIGFIVLFLGFIATKAWAHGMGRFGGFHGGFHGGSRRFHGHFGGFHGGFIHPGFHGGFAHQRSGFFIGFGSPFFFGSPFVERRVFFERPFFGPFFRHPFVSVGPGAVVIVSPFFCFPHRLEFTDQALFSDHLHQLHGVPLRSALSFCVPVAGERFIFFGF